MKAYVKPELYFESFELATHIADCADPNPGKFGIDYQCLPGIGKYSLEDGLASVTGTADPQCNEEYCYFGKNYDGWNPYS